MGFSDQSIDLRRSKYKRSGFVAPEIIMPQTTTVWNYYKAEVFTLGVIILYLGTFSIPRTEFIQQDVDKLKEDFINFYEERAKDDEEKRKIKEFNQILNEMLGIENTLRPDFVNLFYKMIDLKNKKNLQKHILIEDGTFLFNQILSFI